MKNKKIIIMGVIALVLVIGLVLIMALSKKKDDKKEEVISAIITLDINPSIEIEINDNKANRINVLNQEASEIISRDFEGKDIDLVFEEIVKNAKDKGYLEDEHLTIILGMENNDKKIEDKLREACDRSKIPVEIIVPEITEEAKKEAAGYGVTPAKAAVILDLMKSNNELQFDDLKDKSAIELHEMKYSGNWCDHDYVLHGNDCERRVREEDAKEGQACPERTVEYNGKCYEETAIVDGDKLLCPQEYVLKDSKCVTTRTINATPGKYGCSSGVVKTKGEVGLAPEGSGDAREVICVNEADIKHAVSPCEAHDGTETMYSGGKCYWHRAPVIAEGCPGKIQVGGECWDDATGIYICPGRNNGATYNNPDVLCLASNNYTNATVLEYKCESGWIVDGNKCTKEEIIEPMKERTCPEGYTKTQDDRCVDMNKPVDKIVGLVCDAEARLEGNKCVYYERVEAYHN